MEDKKREDTPMKKAEAPKTEAAAKEKSEPQLVTKAPAAAPAQTKTTPKPVSEAATKKKVRIRNVENDVRAVRISSECYSLPKLTIFARLQEEQIQITQQETVSGKPPVAVE